MRSAAGVPRRCYFATAAISCSCATFVPPRLDRMSFFTVPIDAQDLAATVQHEGAAKRLFTPAALAREKRVAPWDLAAVLMHARGDALYGRH